MALTEKQQVFELIKNSRSILVVFKKDWTGDTLASALALVRTLKKIDKPIILTCNKTDNPNTRMQTSEFYQLGLGQPILISAINGSGTGDLLDVISKNLKASRGRKKIEIAKPIIKIAIIYFQISTI